jgi:hypothetical protein
VGTEIETNVTLSSEPVQVHEPDGVKGIVVQLWVRSPEGSWSGCLSSGQAQELARQLTDAGRRADDENERARQRRLHLLTER